LENIYANKSRSIGDLKENENIRQQIVAIPAGMLQRLFVSLEHGA
jgi:hypothetical protein